MLSDRKFVDPSMVIHTMLINSNRSIGAQEDPTEFSIIFVEAVQDGLKAYRRQRMQLSTPAETDGQTPPPTAEGAAPPASDAKDFIQQYELWLAGWSVVVVGREAHLPFVNAGGAGCSVPSSYKRCSSSEPMERPRSLYKRPSSIKLYVGARSHTRPHSTHTLLPGAFVCQLCSVARA